MQMTYLQIQIKEQKGTTFAKTNIRNPIKTTSLKHFLLENNKYFYIPDI